MININDTNGINRDCYALTESGYIKTKLEIEKNIHKELEEIDQAFDQSAICYEILSMSLLEEDFEKSIELSNEATNCFSEIEY